MTTFHVKNFEKFQHYKDRSPPWIKLYNELLENYEFGRLPDAQKGQLIGIWLLASRMDNRIPFDPEWVAQKINATSAVDLDALLASGFIVHGDTRAAEHAEHDLTAAQRLARSNGFGSRHISDEVKRIVWQRDGGQCCECTSAENVEYDHKYPVSKGGNSEVDNIQLLCRPCNRRKRTKIAEQAEHLATQTLSSCTLERETEKRREEKNVRSKKPINEKFEEFWRTYPKRQGPNPKAPALKKFEALVKSGASPDGIIDCARIEAAGYQRSGEIGTRFVPQAITWLNQGRYDDAKEFAKEAQDIKPEFEIESAVKMFANTGVWSRYAGPEPGLTGCKASEELLNKYGLLVDGRKA